MVYGITLLLITISVLGIIYLFRSSIEVNRGWKLRDIGDNQIAYSEIINGNWQTISFRLERYSEEVPRHIIYLPNNWEDFPIWAQEHQKIIVKRLKQAYSAPEYTFHYRTYDSETLY